MNPQELLKKLKQDSTNRVSTTLDAIFAICSEQQKRGLTDFSVSTISRLGFGRNVPKAQSIRNKSGEKYRVLIESFQNMENSNIKLKVSKTDNDWIEEIENPKLRYLAKIQASKLKEANQKLSVIVPPGSVIEVIDKNNFYIGDQHRLTTSERKAIEYLISDQFLKKWDFTKSEYGEVLDKQSDVVFKAATIDALEKALRIL